MPKERSVLLAPIKAVVDFPNYSVTQSGRIWSRKRGQWLSPYLDDGGYQKVRLFNAKGAKLLFLHRIVLLTFVGPCPDGMEGLHKDNNKLNCCLDNLYWGTRSENLRDLALS